MRRMYFTAEFVSRRSILSAVISASKCAHLSSSLASTDEVYLFTKGQVLGEGGILLEVGLLTLNTCLKWPITIQTVSPPCFYHFVVY